MPACAIWTDSSDTYAKAAFLGVFVKLTLFVTLQIYLKLLFWKIRHSTSNQGEEPVVNLQQVFRYQPTATPKQVPKEVTKQQPSMKDLRPQHELATNKLPEK